MASSSSLPLLLESSLFWAASVEWSLSSSEIGKQLGDAYVVIDQDTVNRIKMNRIDGDEIENNE